jgi:hypothetical protein
VADAAGGRGQSDEVCRQALDLLFYYRRISPALLQASPGRV